MSLPEVARPKGRTTWPWSPCRIEAFKLQLPRGSWMKKVAWASHKSIFLPLPLFRHWASYFTVIHFTIRGGVRRSRLFWFFLRHEMLASQEDYWWGRNLFLLFTRHLTFRNCYTFVFVRSFFLKLAPECGLVNPVFSKSLDAPPSPRAAPRRRRHNFRGAKALDFHSTARLGLGTRWLFFF